MGKRGPITPGSKRTTGANIVASGDSFPPPEYLTPLAQSYWNKTVAAFPAGHFTDADKVLLEQYCEAAALHQSSTLALRREGRKYKDRHGTQRKNPAVDDQHQARCDCAMLATKLRITKTSMISPKAAGRAAHEAAETEKIGQVFGDLLFSGEQVRQ